MFRKLKSFKLGSATDHKFISPSFGHRGMKFEDMAMGSLKGHIFHTNFRENRSTLSKSEMRKHTHTQKDIQRQGPCCYQSPTRLK